MNFLLQPVFQIITAVITGLIIGLAGAYFTHLRSKKKDDRSFAEHELVKYREQLERVQTQLNQMLLLIIPSPAPCWVKNTQRQYIYVNQAYKMQIAFRLNLEEDDILNKTDEEIFAEYPDFVKLIKSIDDEAQSSNDLISTRKNVAIPKLDGLWTIIKEIAYGNDGKAYYQGRMYNNQLFL